METKNHGGPAFPEQIAVTPTGDTYSGESGMTLRDYFAAQALQIIAAGDWRGMEYTPVNGLSIIENNARFAYQIADAMLAERAK